MKSVTKGAVVLGMLVMTSCAGVYNPAVVMTSEGMDKFTRYNQDLISSAKASKDTMSSGEKRGLSEFRETAYNERFKAAADHSEPGLIQKGIQGLRNLGVLSAPAAEKK